MRLHVSHKTHYDFVTPPTYGLQQLRLTPKSRAGHHVLNWNLHVQGGVVEAEFMDFNNNYTHLIRLGESEQALSVMCEGLVEITVSDGVLGPHEGFAPLWYFNRTTALTRPDADVKNLLASFSFQPDNLLASMHHLSEHIIAHVHYQTGQTFTDTTAGMATRLGKGVCQDHAHIFISCARELGLPARYVSGYLQMDDRIDQDATHAWAEVWIPDLGWVGFDVSNQICPNEKYVRVASGLDYAQASPISGVTFGHTGETVKVELQVQQQ